MTPGADSTLALEEETRRRLRDVLTAHGVGLAAVFGSAVRASEEPADLDLAFEFADRRPTDDGYASAYLDLYSTLDAEFAFDVDLVDVHSMSPSFASVALDDAVLVLGDDDRLETLARRYAGDAPSVADARERITSAAARLGEGSS